MKGFAILLVLILVLLLFRQFEEGSKGEEDGETSTLMRLESPTAGPSRERQIRLIERNPMIEEFGAVRGTTRGDLEALRDVVRECQLLMKNFDRFHLPGNQEIVKFLQGFNPEKLAWIPEEFSFLNDKGELVDRLGIPVFFHRLSGMRFEYRSAGPDREHWTADDIIVR